MRYGVHLCYNGSAYAGWQRQLNAVSIQEEIEKALSVLLKSDTTITGCGRTDTGVHAANFFAHFDTSTLIEKTEELVYHLNALLPNDIHVFQIFSVNNEWNARFSATMRSYRYHILTERNPFLNNFAWMVPYTLDIDIMQQAAALLIGELDFTSFAKLHGGQKTNICNVSSANFTKNASLITFEISADRFLRNMVRAITGTLVEIGRGRMAVDYIGTILKSNDRSQAGMSVPAHGLFLSAVHYNNDVEIPPNRKTTF